MLKILIVAVVVVVCAASPEPAPEYHDDVFHFDTLRDRPWAPERKLYQYRRPAYPWYPKPQMRSLNWERPLEHTVVTKITQEPNAWYRVIEYPREGGVLYTLVENTQDLKIPIKK